MQTNHVANMMLESPPRLQTAKPVIDLPGIKKDFVRRILNVQINQPTRCINLSDLLLVV